MAEGKSLFVVLSANATQYRNELTGAGRATEDFGRDVDEAGRRTDRFSASQDDAAGSSRRLSSEINQLSGRMKIALDAFALLGPAAVPITTALTPALAGLAAQLVTVVGGVGATVLAFQGIADTVKAVNEYKIDPSEANLDKLKEQLEGLSPAARQFVATLDSMMPALDRVQNSAASGFFGGGGTAALDGLRNNLPQLANLMEAYGDAAGAAARSTAEGLDSDVFQRFIAYLSSEAAPTMRIVTETAKALGGGLAELVMALDPMADDFGTGMLDKAREFQEWAAGLEGNPKFEQFLAYVDDTAPEVLETLGALANMLLQVGEAMAPFGGVALDGLELLADLVSTIADTPAGPAIIGLWAATTLLNRSLSVTAGLMNRMGMGGGAVQGTGSSVFGAIGESASKARSGITGFAGDLRSMGNEYRRTAGVINAGTSGTYQRGITAWGSTLRSALNGTSDAAIRTRATMGNLAKGGGVIAGVAALSTGAAQGLGLQNTAMLGLAGTMAGPWGAAAGATVGFLLDMKASADAANDSLESLDSNLGSGNLAAAGADRDSLAASLNDAEVETGTWDNLTDGMRDAWSLMTTGQKAGAALRDDLGATDQQLINLTGTLSGVAQANGEFIRSYSDGSQNLPFGNFEDLQRVLTSVQPALDSLGISMDDLLSADTGQQASYIAAINDELTRLDSQPARVSAVAKAFRDLDNGLFSTEVSAGQLSTALQTLLNPQLNLVSQTDAWTTAMRSLADETDGANIALRFNSDAAIQNRAAINSRVQQMTATLEAEAAAGASAKDLGRTLVTQRRELLRAGEAAGISKGQLKQYVKQLGLTPRLVRTIIRQTGADTSSKAIANLRRLYSRVPKMVRSDIRTNGIPKTQGDIDRLIAKYKLTGKPVQTLINLRKEAAEQGITRVRQMLTDTEREKTEPKVDVDTGAVSTAVGSIKQMLNSIPDETVNVNVRRNGNGRATGGLAGTGPLGLASGGMPYGGQVHGPGGSLDDLIDVRLSNREYVMPVMAVDHYGVDFMEQVRSRKFGTERPRAAMPDRVRGPAGYGGGGGGRVVVVQSAMPSKIDLVLDSGERFTAYVRGHAADVATQQANRRDAAGTTLERMGWDR